MQKTLKFPANAFEDLQRSGLLPLAANELRALHADSSWAGRNVLDARRTKALNGPRIT
jgi:hypothetical protein